MKYYVNENCIGCGLCASLCEDVFSMNENGVAEAVENETDLESAVRAMESCPAEAIESVN